MNVCVVLKLYCIIVSFDRAYAVMYDCFIKREEGGPDLCFDQEHKALR